MGRYAPAIVAAGILGIVGIAAAYGGNDPGSGATPPTETVETSFEEEPSTAPDPLATEPVVTRPEVEVDEETTVPKNKIKRVLVKGTAGKDVKRVQTRLIELGFDPGEADGIFGDKTVSAVWAYEKLILGTEPSKVRGRVSPEMWLGMQDNIIVKPK